MNKACFFRFWQAIKNGKPRWRSKNGAIYSKLLSLNRDRGNLTGHDGSVSTNSALILAITALYPYIADSDPVLPITR